MDMQNLAFGIAYILICFATITLIVRFNYKRQKAVFYGPTEAETFLSDTMTAEIIILLLSCPFCAWTTWESLLGRSSIQSGSITLILLISTLLYEILFIRPLERRLLVVPEQGEDDKGDSSPA